MSNIFRRPKEFGEVRIIINLADVTKSFKTRIQPREYTKSVESNQIRLFVCSATLSGVYNCVNSAEKSRKYLHFLGGRGANIILHLGGGEEGS